VVIVGLVNLGLGYLAAMALAEPPPWDAWSLPWASVARTKKQPTSPAAPDAPSATSAEQPPAEPERAGIDELPTEWLDELASSGIIAESYVEATAHIARLKVGRYREQLLAAESRARASLASGNAPALEVLVSDLATIHDDWLQRQAAAAEMLKQRNGRLGEYEETAQALEQLMLDQAAQIREVTAVLAELKFEAEVEISGKQLLARLSTLIDSAHGLRDGVQEHLAAMLRAGERFESLGPSVLRDPVTGLSNRVGSEAFLEGWWKSDPDRARPLSIAIIDIDRFTSVNQRLGTRAGDRTITALGKLLDDLIRKDRGFDRLARHGGQSFFLLLGDTGPHNGLTAIERFRQTIEATTFDDQGTEFELTISGGVVSPAQQETAADVFRRARETLRFAKKSGRNRCALDEGEGPKLSEPPQFHVQGRIVSLDVE
jgi:diguanylate cyclase (GGDEF)-like protein